MKFKVIFLILIFLCFSNILFAYDYECTKICNSIEYSQSCRDTWLSMRNYIDQSEKDFVKQCIKDCKNICGDDEDEGCFITNVKIDKKDKIKNDKKGNLK